MFPKIPSVLALSLLFACNTTPSSEAPVAATVPPATTASAPQPAMSTPPAAQSTGRALHYDLVLTTTDGKATGRAAFSIDLTEAAPGSVSFGKNVMFGGGNRADVGTKVKCRLTMEGDSPRLDVDTEVSALDSTGKIRKASAHGTSATPLGAATTVMDSTDAGMQFRLTATPTAGPPIEAKAAESSDTYALDVSVAHTGDGAPPAPTALTLKLAGGAPAIATAGENVPLSTGDAGVASARQSVGSRVKATGRARGGSLEVDLDFESSAIETATPGARIRKITSRSQVIAPFDRPTVAFTGEEDGHHYTVTLTPHRAK